MRYHFWQFLLNQEGQPINNASISVFFAGTTTPVSIYTGELTSDVISIAPQITTTANGYFEFWIGDEAEPSGYDRGTKFKIQWERAGISSGIVDNIEVFQTMDGVDETDPDSIYKNKLISNALAYKFNSHSEHDVLVDGFPIHGLMMVDVLSNENIFNRLISNRLGYQWEGHRTYEFDAISATILENSAHNLQPIQLDSNDSVYNKLMSNETLSNVYGAIDLNTYAIQSLSEVVTESYITLTLPTSAWTLDGSDYYYNVFHEFKNEWPEVFCWNITTRRLFKDFEAESIDEDTTKIIISSPQNLEVKIRQY